MGPPVFDPPRLDSHATGDIDAAALDPDICAVVRDLPLHRYDWWRTSAPGYPSGAMSTAEASKASADILENCTVSASTIPQWST